MVEAMLKDEEMRGLKAKEETIGARIKEGSG